MIKRPELIARFESYKYCNVIKAITDINANELSGELAPLLAVEVFRPRTLLTLDWNIANGHGRIASVNVIS